MAIGEGRDYYEFGDGIGFFLFVCPVLLIFLIANIIWAVTALQSAFQRRGYQSISFFLIVVLLWLASIPVSKALARLPDSHASLQAAPQ